MRKYKWLTFPILAIGCFFFTRILRDKPDWVETYYSQGIYPSIASTLSWLSSLAPFSIDDICYLLLIFFPLIIIILLLFKKIKIKRAGKILLNTFSAVYLLFYLLWGINYFRQPLTQRLNVIDRSPDQTEFIAFLQNYIDEVNTKQCSFDSIDKKKTEHEIENTYKKLAPLLKINYPMGKRPDKKITFSSFYAKTGITGYFGPFFNEVHVNKKVLPIEYPFVLAHEKAHQMGITSEAEANFYAWLICSQSDSPQIQYSGKLFILFHFLKQAYRLKEYKLLIERISPEVKNDFENVRQHWKKLRNETFDKTASKVNDAYLKTNNIKAGIKDYTGVVEHVMNFSLDSAFQQRYHLVLD